MPQLFIRLANEEFAALLANATESRRTPNDQAAWLVVQGLSRWQAQKGFESAIEAEALEDIA
jgi:hypothetical protein